MENNPQNTNTESDSKKSRYLCFSLGAEDYAIPLLDVKEVIALPEITPVPQTPAHFLGIMNLRGQVISVMDLRTKLGIKPKAAAETAIIICDLKPNCIGIVVDSINSVVNPSTEELSEKPEIQSQKATEYINGVFRNEGKLVLLLDIGKALDHGDHRAMQRANSTAMPKAKAA